MPHTFTESAYLICIYLTLLDICLNPPFYAYSDKRKLHMAKSTHFIIYDSVDVDQAIKIYEMCVEKRI